MLHIKLICLHIKKYILSSCDLLMKEIGAILCHFDRGLTPVMFLQSVTKILSIDMELNGRWKTCCFYDCKRTTDHR